MGGVLNPKDREVVSNKESRSYDSYINCFFFSIFRTMDVTRHTG